ncbi:tRNA threonylcarbamoyladenosine dehydratase [Candidatus Pandoraea novymonadis]|uniref:tRNA threonylcarbamoyladenosine dehydratase n=1 Tax=Candidatus Pandoraea novymonadis TaxID=1808959 RepID=A0ABX5FEL1_9BURK|nr:tRNA threonylcarbamoyladenosine dehydratase [Candidatus Pandoraea novymonadis]PSB92148.1 tRNA threonylcarbamoyladenosine dehydratase [Candidatus Pandoraea novymonadis]
MKEIDDFDTKRRFGGIARLYGELGLSILRCADVAIIGIGGVGSWVAEALARSAVGKLTLIDLDNVMESNTNRQNNALNGNYGKSKVMAMAERILAINPLCSVIEIEDFVEVDNLDTILGSGHDWIVDAIDNVHVKTALIAWCVERKQKLITVGGAGGQVDPTRIRIDDLVRTIQDPLLSKVRAKLRRQYGFKRDPKAKFNVPAVYSDEPLIYPEIPQVERPLMNIKTPQGLNCAGFGSSMCVTAAFGMAASAYVLRKLTGC